MHVAELIASSSSDSEGRGGGAAASGRRRSAFSDPPRGDRSGSGSGSEADDVGALRRRIASLALQDAAGRWRFYSLRQALRRAAALPPEQRTPGLTALLQRHALSRSDARFVDAALADGDPDEVACEGHSIRLRRADLHTLRPRTWLNDEVVNLYLSLLADRSKRPGFPSLHVFNSFFLIKLGGMARYNYGAVRRWTKQVDLFAHQLVLIPVHKPGHWALVAVNLELGTLSYYDSLGTWDEPLLHAVRRYLEDEFADKHPQRAADPTPLAIVRPAGLPLQTHCDCGVFLCQYAEAISRSAETVPAFDFSHADMPYLRRRMVLELTQLFVP